MTNVKCQMSNVECQMSLEPDQLRWPSKEPGLRAKSVGAKKGLPRLDVPERVKRALEWVCLGTAITSRHIDEEAETSLGHSKDLVSGPSPGPPRIGLPGWIEAA